VQPDALAMDGVLLAVRRGHQHPWRQVGALAGG
jgi:hypothetical protein